VDGAVDWLQEPPEDGGGGVAEDGSLAAGEDRGHEAAVEREPAMSHGVDALVNTHQLPFANPNRDRFRP